MNVSPSTFIRYLLLLLVTISLSTCSKDEVIPAYISIPAIDVRCNTNVFGSDSSRITDAWVYFEDGNAQGIYELPCTFPIRNTGSVKLHIIAGVQANGIAATRVIYPFYSDTLKAYNLEPGKVTTIRPIVDYFPTIKFALGPVDFETGNPFAGSEYVNTAPDVFEGHASAKITNYDTAYVDVAQSGSITIPARTSAAFLELNYKNDIQFTVGLSGTVTGFDANAVDLVTLAPHSNWNKVYINLTPTVGAAQADTYQLYFYVKKDNVTQKHNVVFDNVKLIYFPL